LKIKLNIYFFVLAILIVFQSAKVEAATICVQSCDSLLASPVGTSNSSIRLANGIPLGNGGLGFVGSVGFVTLIPFKNSDGWNYFASIFMGDGKYVSIPFFDGWDVNDVTTPTDWIYEIKEAQPQDQFRKVAVWTNQGARIPRSAITLSFTSSYGPTRVFGKYDNGNSTSESDLFIPLTLSAAQAGLLPFDASPASPIPLPASAMLVAIGLAMFRALSASSQRCVHASGQATAARYAA
jgi:hypothetical protein